MDNYIERDGVPVMVSDIKEWARWHEKQENRRVAWDTLADGVDVSTVFLGIDHSFGGGTPMLYETMVFGGALSDECERYGTRKEAEVGHAAMVERVKAAELKVISLARFTRNHAAALLRKARAQRDAETKRAEEAELALNTWCESSVKWKNSSEEWRELSRLNSEHATAWRKQAEEADAARVVAETELARLRAEYERTLQAWKWEREQRELYDEQAHARQAAESLAEREHARAEAAQEQADKLLLTLRRIIGCAPKPAFAWSEYAGEYDAARRLLAAHKATERA